MEENDLSNQIPKLTLESVPLKLLAICGSPRRDRNSHILLDLGVEGAMSAVNVEVEHYTFDGKKISGCTACNAFCIKNHDCVHKGEAPGTGRAMWDPENKLIRFVAEQDFSDPSYHLPHFYQLFALWADEEDRPFWEAAAKASREYLHKACHPKTGLCAEYAAFDGAPQVTPPGQYGGRHDWFYSDAYRTAANIGLDYAWFAADEGQRAIAANIQRFFSEEQKGSTEGVFLIDGTPVPGWKALHPVGLLATLAEASLASDGPYAQEWVRRFWETPLRQGDRRYYDNCLYFFALLALSGKYRIW